MRYVILKKINNVWYATRNRYTAQELETLVDKQYNDIVDFELINDGECQGLDNGVIIVKDDERELNENGTYLTDDLELETKTEKNNSIFGYVMFALFLGWLACGVYGILFIGAVCIIAKIYNNYVNDDTDVQAELPENHKTIGMM